MDDLAPHRKQIDAIDSELVHLLAERFALVKEVKALKEATGKAAFDEERWSAIRERIEEQASQENLNPQAIQKIFDAIHDYALHQVYGA